MSLNNCCQKRLLSLSLSLSHITAGALAAPRQQLPPQLGRRRASGRGRGGPMTTTQLLAPSEAAQQQARARCGCHQAAQPEAQAAAEARQVPALPDQQRQRPPVSSVADGG